MNINGFKINYSAADIKNKISKQMRKVVLIDKKCAEYKELSEGNKKALGYLVNAAKIMNDVALEMDHPMNLVQ